MTLYFARILVASMGLFVAAASVQAQQSMSGVGYLRFPVGSCTGVLVGPREVLTAAHCMGQISDADLPDKKPVIFRTGAYPGRPSKDYPVASFTVHPLYKANIETGYVKIPYDLALLRLSVPVPVEVAAPVAIAETVPEDASFVIASWRDFNAPRARERACSKATELDFLTLMCRVQKGESGSPVFRVSGEVPELVAIVTNSIESGPLSLALSAPVAPRIGQLRALLPIEQDSR
ncbi:MAG: trypsin-like serine protease [Alphaproteobacteria bacterium]|nr:trypsin-like serine protease [Alphaproteobacteria bacterium]